MASATAAFEQTVRRLLQTSNASLRREAQELFDGIPVKQRIPRLLALVHRSDGHSIEERVAFAEFFSRQLAFNFGEFFEGLGTQEERLAYLNHFCDCCYACADCSVVSEQLCIAFADIGWQLHQTNSWKEERERLTSTLFVYLENEVENHIRVIGWSVLGRVPQMIDTESHLLRLIPLFERALCAENLQVAFESSCSLLSVIIHMQHEHELVKSMRHLCPLLASTLVKFLTPGKEKLLRRLLAASADYRNGGFFNGHDEKFVEVLAPFAMDTLPTEEQRPIMALSLKLLGQFRLSGDTFVRMMEVLPSIIQRELEKGSGTLSFGANPLLRALEKACCELLHDAHRTPFDFRSRLLNAFELTVAQPPPDKLKAIVAILITVIARNKSLYDEMSMAELVPLINDGLKHGDPGIRRSYCHLFQKVIQENKMSCERAEKLYESTLEDFVEASRVLQEKDPLLRSMTYKRFALFFENVKRRLTDMHLRSALSEWVFILESETKNYVTTGVGTALDEALAALSNALQACQVPCGQQAGCLFRVLKMAACLVDFKPEFRCCSEITDGQTGRSGKQPVKPSCCRVLSLAAVTCALAALSHHHKAGTKEHVPWIIVALRRLRPVPHSHGLNQPELRFAHDFQEAWKGVTELCRDEPLLLDEILPSAVDSVLWKATAKLPIEEIEDVPEAKHVARFTGKVYHADNRRLFCVDRERLHSKSEAVKVLKQFYLQNFGDVLRPQLPKIAAAIVDLAVTSTSAPGLKNCEISMDFSFSKHAVGVLPEALFVAGCNGGMEWMISVWAAVKPTLLDALQNKRWQGCPDDLLKALNGCFRVLPEEQVVLLLPSIVSIVSKAINWFDSTSHCTTVDNEDKDDLEDSDVLGSTEMSQELVPLIETTVMKCGQDRVQVLLESLAAHCDKLTAEDAHPRKLELGLELLSNWLSCAASQGKNRMPWLLGRLVAHMKRFATQVLKQDQRINSLYDEWEDEAVLEKLAGCLRKVVSLYAQDSDALAGALQQLLPNLVERPPDCDGKRMMKRRKRFEDKEAVEKVIVWTSRFILEIVKPATGILVSGLASKAVKAVLSSFPLDGYHEGLDRNLEFLCELFNAKHPAMVANASEMVALARRATPDWSVPGLEQIARDQSVDVCRRVPYSEEDVSESDYDDYDDYAEYEDCDGRADYDNYSDYDADFDYPDYESGSED